MSNRNTNRNKEQRQLQQQQQRRLVLSEEEYTTTLSSIVERDYFPDNQRLQAQNALLDARLRGDAATAVAIRRATRKLMDHEESVLLQREQDDRDLLPSEEQQGGGGGGLRKRPRPLQEETITGFHARVTNEDDHEFDTNLKQEIADNRRRLQDVVEGGKQTTNWLQLEDMASDDFAPESNRIAASDWKKPAIKNGLFFNPTPLLLGDRSQTSSNEVQPKMLTANASSSALMLPPASKKPRGGTPETRPLSRSVLLKSQLVEYVPKHHLERKIDPSQTRFPSQLKVMPAPDRSNNVNDVAGLVEYRDTDNDDGMSSTDTSYYSTDLDAPLRPVEIERERRRQKITKTQQQQQRNQRSYVAMTPQIVPGAGNQSPITTWGTVDGTPLVLSGKAGPSEQDTQKTETASSSFRLPGENEREKAARKAEANMALRTKRAKQVSSSSTTRDKSNKRGEASSTPIFPLSLLNKRKIVPSRSRDAFASALRMSYTPQRTSLSSSSKTCNSKLRGTTGHGRLKKDHAYNATPQI